MRERRDRVVTALRRLTYQRTERLLRAPLGERVKGTVELRRAADEIAALEGQELEQFNATVWPEVRQRIRPTRR